MVVTYKWLSAKNLSKFPTALFGAVLLPLFSDLLVAYKWVLLMNGVQMENAKRLFINEMLLLDGDDAYYLGDGGRFTAYQRHDNIISE